LSDLQEAVPKAARLAGRIVVVVRLADEVYAVDGICPHWQGPLAEGRVSPSRREIICPWHRFRYSLVDGRCVASNNRPAVETFPVTVEGDLVLVELSEKPAKVATPTTT
jgi:nitrite reductase/ring-hydroxylating ferredoxin subunit